MGAIIYNLIIVENLNLCILYLLLSLLVKQHNS